MPNWATTYYAAEGDKEQLKELHAIMKELEQMKAPGLHENDFGAAWLGNLVIRLGGDWEKIYCRGSWEELRFEEGTLRFQTESAWDEPREVRKFIEEKFPSIKLYFQCEEHDWGIYKSNDRDGKYFAERYFLDVENGAIGYYENLKYLIQDIERITGDKNLKTFEECEKALQSYYETHELDWCQLEAFKIVDD